jgi:hypothetical protein
MTAAIGLIGTLFARRIMGLGGDPLPPIPSCFLYCNARLIVSNSSACAFANFHFFLQLLENEIFGFEEQICDFEEELANPSSTIPEDIRDSILAAVGKAKLLMAQKMGQFKGLCEKNIVSELPLTAGLTLSEYTYPACASICFKRGNRSGFTENELHIPRIPGFKQKIYEAYHFGTGLLCLLLAVKLHLLETICHQMVHTHIK